MKLPRLRFVALFLVAVAIACGAQDFDPQSHVNNVRIFATRADKPYAKPGESVTLEALLGDGRKDKTHPLKHYWIPLICLNPTDDLYYACFAPPSPGDAGVTTRLIPTVDAGIGEGGGGGGGNPLANLPQGADIGGFLPQGTTFGFTMPLDAIQPRTGSDPYGLVVVFDIACTGHITTVQRDPAAGPQQVPLACTGDDGLPVPPSDYVIGISRVYSYDTRTNTNPVIEKMTLDGVDVDPKAGLTVDKCTEHKSADCKDIKIDVHVSDASWEDNPSDIEHQGTPFHEQIWVDWYSDMGEFTEDARLLFDAQKGRNDDSAVKFHAPKDPGDGTVWAVVHDNRGGAAWMVVPLHVR
jgi:hypothetical protein